MICRKVIGLKYDDTKLDSFLMISKKETFEVYLIIELKRNKCLQ